MPSRIRHCKDSEVSFESLSCIGRPLWDLCECQTEFGNVAKINEVCKLVAITKTFISK